MLLILLIILLVLAFGGLPAWGAHPYGWYPSGLLMVVVVILLAWLLMGRL